MGSEGADFGSLRFSTGAVPERERLTLWREMIGRQIVQADTEQLSDQPFEAELSLRALPGLRTMACFTSLVRMHRTRELVADGDDALVLLINGSGALAPSHLGREISLGAGDAVLVLNAEPAAMIHSQLSTAVLVPRTALAPLVAQAEDMAMRLIPQRNDALRLLTGYLAMVRDDLALATPELRHLVAKHIHDLMAAAIGATRDGIAIAKERGVRAARLAAIKADVIARAGERGLTLAAVAARHRMSLRSVQLLFESDGATFSQFLLEQRLVRAHRMLGDPRNAAMTVSAIALAAGFGDLSHFNRVFRRRYGATPSDVRAASLARTR
jgi:AraC-like DNA-binding protein